MTPRLIQFIALVLTAALLFAAGSQVAPINQARVDNGFTFTGDIGTNSPPDLAFMLAVGGPLRSMFAHILWNRANRLKDEGKFYEACELANLICKLQPRFPDVWKFHAWNMAFNISVATYTPQERWAWINRAISLLRDEGISKNPRSVKLYHELSWTFFFKIGEFMDDFHLSYKKRWARLMDVAVGAPGRGTTAEVIAGFARIAQAPPTLEALRESDPGVGFALDALAETDTAPDLTLLNRLADLQRYRYGEAVADPDLLKRIQLSKELKALRAWDENPALASAKEKILLTVRHRVLVDVYAMDPARMLKLMQKFDAPFDWRLPNPHAIYWAAVGLEQGIKFGGNAEFDLINTDKMTMSAMRMLLSRGQLIYQQFTDNPDNDYYLALPDWRYADPCNQAYETLVKNWSAFDPMQPKTVGIRNAHENFMQESVEALYMAGQVKKAQAYYDDLRERARNYDSSMKELYSMTLGDFVTWRIAQNTDNYTQVIRGVFDYLNWSFTFLAAGDAETAARYLAGSRTIYERYMKDKKTDPNVRRQLPPFNELYLSTAGMVLSDPSQGPSAIVSRQRLWNALDLSTRQALYDRLKPIFSQWTKITGMDIDKVFPEPAGLAEWRKAHPLPTTQPSS